jgi:hypothetical protein
MSFSQSQGFRHPRWGTLLAGFAWLAIQACTEAPLSPDTSSPAHRVDEPLTAVEGMPLGSSLTVDSILTFSNAGVHTATVRPGGAPPVGGRAPSENAPTGEELLALVETLETLASQLGERSGGTAIITKVARAAASPAPQQAGWLPELPVSIASTPLLEGQGRPGVRRDFRVKGTLKVSHFRHFVSAAPIGWDRVTATRDRGWDGGAPRGVSLEDLLWNPLGDGNPGGGAQANQTAASEYCETEWDGVVYTGECATQAEIDDLLALVAALDYEVEQWLDEVDAASGGGGGGCDPAIDPGCEIMYSVVQDLIASCEDSDDPVVLGDGGCVEQVTTLALAVGSWITARGAAWYMLGKSKVAAGALAFVGPGLAIASAGVAVAAGFTIACMMA